MKLGLYCRKSSEDSGKQIQSIEDQTETLRDKAKREGLVITKTYTESKSAKTPGRREQFNLMIEDLKAGKIQGIICWKLDRLSRNPLEGGIIMQHLQDGTIQKIVTYEKTYFPGDNGLLMTIELGMATEYSRALAENTKRGQKFKTKKGWYPSVAPLGYINTTDRLKGEKEIHPDPERFNLVRKCWDLALDGVSGPQIIEKISSIGLRTIATRTKITKNLSLSGLYKLLKNPFYYGCFNWNGELHQGNHEPMVTKREFDEVQKIISGRNRPKTHKHQFNFTCIMVCGECGASITAAPKDKVRKDGSINKRVYYRCTGRKVNTCCSQKAIRNERLEAQMLEIVELVTLPEAFVEWAIKWLKDEYQEFTTKQESVSHEQVKQIEKINLQINKLVDMKLDDLIDTDTFKARKETLMAEKQAIEEHIKLNTMSQDYKIDKTIEVFDFCKIAKHQFIHGSREDRREVLETLGIKWVLQDGKLTVDMTGPFKAATNLTGWSEINNPRFPTLPTRIETGFDVETCTLIKNGGDLARSISLPENLIFIDFRKIREVLRLVA